MVIRLIAFISVLMLFSSNAIACSCGSQNFRDSFYNSDLVFEGTVLSTVSVTKNASSTQAELSSFSDDISSYYSTVFSISRPLKGRPQETRTIVHSVNGTSCVVHFDMDTTYRIYAYRRGAHYFTSLCSNNSVVGFEKELEVMRAEAVQQIFAIEEKLKAGENLPRGYRRIQRNIDLIGEENQFLSRYQISIKQLKRLISETNAGLDFGPISFSDFSNLVEEIKRWKDYENVADIYLYQANLYPELIEYRVEAAEALNQAQQFEEARELSKQVLELDDDNSRALSQLALSNFVLDGIVHPKANSFPNLKVADLKIQEHRIDHLDLHGAEIQKLNLSAVQISNLNLSHTSIWNGNFQDSTFRNARLEASKVSGNFSDTDLRNSILSWADFYESSFVNADLRKVTAKETNFSGVNLKGVDLRKADLSNANFFNSNLVGADLRNTVLTETNFTGARFDCATQLPKTIDIQFEQMIPVSATCEKEKQNRDFSKQNWRYANFSNLILKKANFSETELVQVDFLGTSLDGSDFSNSKGRADFSGSDLTEVSFLGAKLDANFHKSETSENKEKQYSVAVLNKTDFTGATLETASFLGSQRSFSPEIDYSTAIFENALFSCRRSGYVKTVNNYDEDDFPPWFDEVDDAAKTEYMRNWRENQKNEYNFAQRWLTAEGKMIRYIKAKFPSLQLDEECRGYL